MSKLDIPPDQMDRILPVLEALLADLRRLTQDLPPQAEPALVYQPDAQTPDTEAAQ
jgi:hypothetical protein